MKKGLRSRLAKYGDEEFALFLRRGFLKGEVVGRLLRGSRRAFHLATYPAE